MGIAETPWLYPQGGTRSPTKCFTSICRNHLVSKRTSFDGTCRMQASTSRCCSGVTARNSRGAFAGRSLGTQVFKCMRTDRYGRALMRCGASPSPVKGLLSMCHIAAVVAKNGTTLEIVVSALCAQCTCAAGSIQVKMAVLVAGSHGSATCRTSTGERERLR